jgi:hypothetical protein
MKTVIQRVAQVAAALACLSLAAVPAMAQDAPKPDPHRYWPAQKTPRGVVTIDMAGFAAPTLADGTAGHAKLGEDHMLAVSLAGLAAQAVNENRGDEMVWIDFPRDASEYQSYRTWFESAKQRMKFEDRGVVKPWDLARRYQQQGIVKGYVLYRYDNTAGGPTIWREGTDASVNAATTMAGLLGGVMVSEAQEAQARSLGLTMLFDARGKDAEWVMANHGEQLDRTHVLAQDPQMPMLRDIAVANRSLVVWGTGHGTERVYEWMPPMGYVIGWNGADEGGFVSQLSRWGHTLLPSNWAQNVPLLSATDGTPVELPPVRGFDPRSADVFDQRPAVSYLMSDGDNVQWMMGNFFHHRDYWASPSHGQFPVGYGMPVACLVQAVPDAMIHTQKTQPKQTDIFQSLGGYFYCDLLAVNRTPEVREKLLIEHARRLDALMARANVRTIKLVCMDVQSEAAKQAYEILVREMPHAIGMFVIQYSPYEAGDGETYWYANARGEQIPVVTAKYSLWGGLDIPRSGTPAKIASLVNADAKKAQQAGDVFQAWVVVHVWSSFRDVQGDDPMAEEIPAGAPRDNARMATEPTAWSIRRLDPAIRVVGPEELVWRMRAVHDPAGTREAIQRLGTP